VLTLDAEIQAFLREPFVATLSTVDPDGGPRVAVVWFRLEPDGTIMVNSLDGRRWPANLRREPRAALSVIDPADGLRWVGLTGDVEAVTDDQAVAQADIADLARRYHADDPDEAEQLIATRFTKQRRISFRIRPTAVHDHRD
jgi:PPOX class probable F420-dependent enzyme